MSISSSQDDRTRDRVGGIAYYRIMHVPVHFSYCAHVYHMSVKLDRKTYATPHKRP